MKENFIFIFIAGMCAIIIGIILTTDFVNIAYTTDMLKSATSGLFAVIMVICIVSIDFKQFKRNNKE